MLSTKQLQTFEESGFIVIDDVLSSAQLQAMQQQATSIVKNWQKSEQYNATIFSTKNNNDRSNEDYFLDSGEDIRCFFEEDAFDDQGELVQNISLSVNKIGHGLHELDPTFKEISHLPILAEIAKDLGIITPQLRQSMYIFKQPRVGGVVNWHQDATFFYTTPQSVVTFWFAVEDATLENGCLWVKPGGHKEPLREQFIRNNRDISMRQLNPQPWPSEIDGAALPVKAGTLVCFNGLLPHYSAPNTSDKSRHAYTLHVTDGQCTYATSNWLQNENLPLTGFA